MVFEDVVFDSNIVYLYPILICLPNMGSQNYFVYQTPHP